MAPSCEQQPPGQPSPGPHQRLSDMQAAVAGLQATALDSRRQLAAARAAAAGTGAHAALVAAYCRRLQRLAALLQQYDEHLQAALASLGLSQHGGSEERSAEAAAEALSAALHQIEEQLAAATLDAGAAPTPQELLQLGACAAPLVASIAAAGPAAVLSSLQACIQQDRRLVDGWPALAPALPASPDGDPAAAASPLGPAFAKLHREQKEQWQAAEARRQQLEALREEVAVARAALHPAAGQQDPAAAEAAARTQLTAEQAGLRAELKRLSHVQKAAEATAAAAAQRAAAVQAAQADVAALEAKEAALDDAVRALCSADGQVMRHWRQGTWRAQEAVEAGVLAQRQPLAALAERLAKAQRDELAAFQRQTVSAAGQPAAAASSQEPGGSTPSGSRVMQAAQLLDPLAGLKTEAAAEAAMTAAREELQQLQPAAEQWAELAATAASRLAALQATAEELEGQSAALQEEGGSAALEQLRQAVAAAEEGTAAIGRARQALSEWWTSPAVTATPWLKREGRSAEEWLRLLGDQLRVERQRAQVLTDANRRIKAAN